jgi:hypothetical protein
LTIDKPSAENLERFLVPQKNLQKLYFGLFRENEDLPKNFVPIFLQLWNLDSLVAVNNGVMDLLRSVPEDQLKNHRFTKLRVEQHTGGIRRMSRYFRLVPAITCLHFPLGSLDVKGIELPINNLENLKEFVVHEDPESVDVNKLDRLQKAFRQLRIRKLEKLTLVDVELENLNYIYLRFSDLVVFIKNHPTMKEMELKNSKTDRDGGTLAVKNFKQLEMFVQENQDKTIRFSFENLKIRRK